MTNGRADFSGETALITWRHEAISSLQLSYVKPTAHTLLYSAAITVNPLRLRAERT